MTIYIEKIAEVGGKAVIGQSYDFYNDTIKIKKTVSGPVKIGATVLNSEEEVFVNTSDPKTNRDLLTNIGKYTVLGNNVQSQLKLIGIDNHDVQLFGDVAGSANSNTIVNNSVTQAKLSTEVSNVINQGHKVVTTSEKNALSGTVTGSQVFDSTLKIQQHWNGSSWVSAPRMIGCKISKTMANDTISPIVFDTEHSNDQYNMYDSATNPERLYCPYTGWYHAVAQVDFVSPNIIRTIATIISHSGSGHVAINQIGNCPASTRNIVTLSGYFFGVAGSYISVFCSRDDGYPVGQINAGNTFLTLVLVGSYWV